MLNLNHHPLEPHYLDLEHCIRSALTFGELSPAAEAQIKRLIIGGHLSPRDRTLLDLLQDAIQDGCIRRVQPVQLLDASSIHANG